LVVTRQFILKYNGPVSVTSQYGCPDLPVPDMAAFALFLYSWSQSFWGGGSA